MTSVLIALEEPFVQMGVRVTIENTESFDVAGFAATAEEVVPTVAELAPDMLILDSHFQQTDAKLVPKLTSDHPACKILVMVDHTDEGCTLRALLAGPRQHWLEDDALKTIQECCLLALRESARGCLPKGSTPERLIAALQAVAAGEVWTGPGLASYWMHSFRPADPDSNNRITARELEAIELVVSGLSNREIAQRLGLSEQTVKNRTARIMDKLEVRNRVELVLYAIRERLV